jgi:hypothetical protein
VNALVTVLVPTYRHAVWIGRALQSLLVQELTNWDCINRRMEQVRANELIAPYGSWAVTMAAGLPVRESRRL